MITRRKWGAKLLLIIAIVLVFDSIGTVAEIGLRGLFSLLEWTAGGSYIVMFVIANCELFGFYDE